MALSDLTKAFESGSLHLDERARRELVADICKLFEWLAKVLDEAHVDTLVTELLRLLSSDKSGGDADLGGIGIDVLTHSGLNILIQNLPSVSLFFPDVVDTLISMLKAEDDQMKALIFIETLICFFGKFKVPRPENQELVGRLTDFLWTKRGLVRKKVSVALMCVMQEDDVGHYLISTLLPHIEQKDSHLVASLHTLILAIRTFPSSIGRIGEIDHIFDIVSLICRETEDEEIREMCLQAAEYALDGSIKLSQHTARNLSDLAIQYVKYDPNYIEDMEIEEPEDEEFDFDGCEYDDEMSWKLRKSCIRILRGLALQGLSVSACAAGIVSRTEDRNDAVVAEAAACLRVLSENCSDPATREFFLQSETISKVTKGAVKSAKAMVCYQGFLELMTCMANLGACFTDRSLLDVVKRDKPVQYRICELTLASRNVLNIRDRPELLNEWASFVFSCKHDGSHKLTVAFCAAAESLMSLEKPEYVGNFKEIFRECANSRLHSAILSAMTKEEIDMEKCRLSLLEYALSRTYFGDQIRDEVFKSLSKKGQTNELVLSSLARVVGHCGFSDGAEFMKYMAELLKKPKNKDGANFPALANLCLFKAPDSFFGGFDCGTLIGSICAERKEEEIACFVETLTRICEASPAFVKDAEKTAFSKILGDVHSEVYSTPKTEAMKRLVAVFPIDINAIIAQEKLSAVANILCDNNLQFEESNDNLRLLRVGLLGCAGCVDKLVGYFDDSDEIIRKFAVQNAAASLCQNPESVNLLISRTSESNAKAILNCICQFLSGCEFEGSLDPIFRYAMDQASKEDSRGICSEVLAKCLELDSKYISKVESALLEESTSLVALWCIKSYVNGKPDISVLHRIMIDIGKADQRDAEVERGAVSVLLSLVRAGLADTEITNMILKKTELRRDLIESIQMGPFRHQIDKGLEARKTAYEALLLLLEGHPELAAMALDALARGFEDELDIKLVILHGLSRFEPGHAVLGKFPEVICQGMRKLFELKARENAVKQEIERLNELRRAAAKALNVLSAEREFLELRKKILKEDAALAEYFKE